MSFQHFFTSDNYVYIIFPLKQCTLMPSLPSTWSAPVFPFRDISTGTSKHIWTQAVLTNTHTWTLCNYGLMCLSRDSVKKMKEVNIMSCPWSHLPSVGVLSHRDLWPAASIGSSFRKSKTQVCCGLRLAYHWSILQRLKPKLLQNTWRNNNRTSQPILKGFSLDCVQNNVFKSQHLPL